MVRILKAELEYSKVWFLVFAIGFIPFSFFILHWNQIEFSKAVSTLMNGMFAANGMLFLVHLMKIKKERSDWFFLVLPIRINQIAWFRIIFGNLLWAGLSILLWIVILFSDRFVNLREILVAYTAWTGLWLVFNAVALIFNDLKSLSCRPLLKSLAAGFSISGSLFAVSFILWSALKYDDVFLGIHTHPLLAFLFILWGIILSGFDIYLFKQKQIFID